MQVHQLKPKNKSKSRKIVGRGGKKGTYSGRGNKGQAARAGRKMVPIIRELIKRYPKLKGYRRFVMQKEIAVVNLISLENNFKSGDAINPEVLLKKGIISALNGKTPKVKILGKGEITKKLSFENCTFSQTAQKAIEKAGGTIK